MSAVLKTARGIHLLGKDVESYNIAQRARFDTDITRLREGMVVTQFWSLYVPSSFSPLEAMRAQLEQIRHRAPADREVSARSGLCDDRRRHSARDRSRPHRILTSNYGPCLTRSTCSIRHGRKPVIFRA